MAGGVRATGRACFAAVHSAYAAAPLRTVLLCAWIAWRCVQPVVLAAAIGGATEAVVEGNSVSTPLVTALVIFLADALAVQAFDALSGSLSWRIDRSFQQAAISSALAPDSIKVLESQAAFDSMSLLKGELGHPPPSTAFALFEALLPLRLSAAVAAAILTTLEPVGGALVVGAALFGRVWIRRDIDGYADVARAQSMTFRRAAYVRNLLFASSAAKELRIFGIGEWLASQYKTLFGAGIKEIWRRRSATTPLAVAAAVAQGLALAVVAALLFRSDRSIGEVIFAVQLSILALDLQSQPDLEVRFRRAVEPVHELKSFAALTGSAGIARRPPPLQVATPPSHAQLASAEIQLDDVSFAYDGITHIISDLSLTLPAGQSVAVVGPNGVGKTTLIKLLTGLYEPDAGSIRINGAVSSAADRRGLVALVSQDFLRLPLSLAENVLLDGTSAEIEAALATVAADRFASALPNGTDTIVLPGYSASVDLSGGQWQRVALARAVARLGRGAQIAVLDEPTASLDVRAERTVFESMLTAATGRTVVLVTHRLWSVQHVDRVVVLEGGSIAQDGSHRTLMQEDGWYRRNFNLQASQYIDPQTPV